MEKYMETTFESLPVELKVHIFSLLPRKSLKVVGSVSRGWKELIDRYALKRDESVLIEPDHLLYELKINKSWPVEYEVRSEDVSNDFSITFLKRKVKPKFFRSMGVKKHTNITFGRESYDTYVAPWLISPSGSKVIKEMMLRLQPIQLTFNLYASSERMAPILREKYCRHVQILRLNITDLRPDVILSIKKFQSLRSLTIYDLRPEKSKLFALNGLPLVSLNLYEQRKADVLPSRHLRDYFSSTTFDRLVSLSLRNSRINDFTASILRDNCPKLWSLEIHKGTDLSNDDMLTKKGLLDFLHLPLLKHLEVTFPENEDWFYRRKRWVKHSCTLECPIGVDGLLEEWDDVSPTVDL